jgi:hypothetical protein
MIKLGADQSRRAEGRRRPGREGGEGHHRRQAAPFQGPIKDNAGKERVAAGKSMSDDDMQKMDFYVVRGPGDACRRSNVWGRCDFGRSDHLCHVPERQAPARGSITPVASTGRLPHVLRRPLANDAWPAPRGERLGYLEASEGWPWHAPP